MIAFFSFFNTVNEGFYDNVENLCHVKRILSSIMKIDLPLPLEVEQALPLTIGQALALELG